MRFAKTSILYLSELFKRLKSYYRLSFPKFFANSQPLKNFSSPNQTKTYLTGSLRGNRIQKSDFLGVTFNFWLLTVPANLPGRSDLWPLESKVYNLTSKKDIYERIDWFTYPSICNHPMELCSKRSGKYKPLLQVW